MNKRKLELNEIKKAVTKGRKCKLIKTKYEVAMSFFKQKEMRTPKIFAIYFQALVKDFIDQLLNAEIIYKCQNQIKEELHQIQIVDDKVKLDGPYLKYYSKQYPIQEIVDCLAIRKDLKTSKLSVEINTNKQMLFFKHLRKIYPEFCFCVGEKIIIEKYELKNFYEAFKAEWAKLYERGRMSMTEKMERMICRTLYFLGALIENNIFEEIEDQERKKREDNLDLGTKSEKKKNVKGITHQVSSTYSFGSTDMLSNFSHGLKSQKSNNNEESYCKAVFSQKSEKIVRRERCFLWDKIEVQDLKITIPIQHPPLTQNSRYAVDLLSNDVENILIEQAFKIQKLKDACGRNKYENITNQQHYSYEAYFNYYHQPYYQPYQQYQHSYIQQTLYPQQEPDLYTLRRPYNISNLVETRKTHSRLGDNKYS